jgi:hypothetical protein
MGITGLQLQLDALKGNDAILRDALNVLTVISLNVPAVNDTTCIYGINAVRSKALDGLDTECLFRIKVTKVCEANIQTTNPAPEVRGMLADRVALIAVTIR